VACYVSQKPLRLYSVLHFFPSDSEDDMALVVYPHKGGFGSSLARFRIDNAYGRPIKPPHRSVSPATSYVNCVFDYLVVGDLIIHNPAADPFRVLSSNEERQLASFLTGALI